VVSGQRRELPSHASLRYLKLEAKRRLADGEFTALHQAQLAIATEHGQPNWAVLRRLIAGQDRPDCLALTQLRWVISRFSDADDPGWPAPAADEVREHFTAVCSALGVVSVLASRASLLRCEPVVLVAERLYTRVRFGGIEAAVTVEAEPPHRLSGLVIQRVAAKVSDPRVAGPPTTAGGAPPAGVADMIAGVSRDVPFAGLALAGADSPADGKPGPEWATATGWADLESGEVLSDAHRFPAFHLTTLVTAVLVLQLVADGKVRLDDPANRHLRTVRLADDTTTIRELLSHTGGVQNLPEPLPFTPRPPALDDPDLSCAVTQENFMAEQLPFGPRPPALATLADPWLPCTGNRGTYDYSHAGYAALGQLVTDITGLTYPRAAARLVLGPLSMRESRFPARSPSARAVTGYEVDPDGSLRPVPRSVCLLPAAGGLWTTARDLTRFGLGWPTLLPPALAAEAITPHAQLTPGRSIGLGWRLRETMGTAELSGHGPGGAASLLVTHGGGRAHAALASQRIPLESVNLEASLEVTDPDLNDDQAQAPAPGSS
jgi:CubicO group peptidase (beta-lactamase class C family)